MKSVAKHQPETAGQDMYKIPVDQYQDMDGSSKSTRMLFHKAHGRCAIPAGVWRIEDARNIGSSMVSAEGALADLDITDRRANDVVCWGSVDAATAISIQYTTRTRRSEDFCNPVRSDGRHFGSGGEDG